MKFSTRRIVMTSGLIASAAAVAALIGTQAASGTNVPSASTAQRHAASMTHHDHMANMRMPMKHQSSTGHSEQVAEAKKATATFHNIANAEQSGYGLFQDTAGLTCIADPSMGGGMGVHYVNGDNVNDPTEHARHPEATVYRLGSDGTLHLAALEYLVVKSAWDADHAGPPKLFGHTFMFTDAPNRYGLPPFYSLHAWVWDHNPAGEFAMWNPQVTCPRVR